MGRAYRLGCLKISQRTILMLDIIIYNPHSMRNVSRGENIANQQKCLNQSTNILYYSLSVPYPEMLGA